MLFNFVDFAIRFSIFKFIISWLTNYSIFNIVESYCVWINIVFISLNCSDRPFRIKIDSLLMICLNPISLKNWRILVISQNNLNWTQITIIFIIWFLREIYRLNFNIIWHIFKLFLSWPFKVDISFFNQSVLKHRQFS